MYSDWNIGTFCHTLSNCISLEMNQKIRRVVYSLISVLLLVERQLIFMQRYNLNLIRDISNDCFILFPNNRMDD